jgi:DNA end-binding protein Ku
VPQSGGKNAVSPGELKMAQQLIDSMAGAWDPDTYRDEYREDLLRMIEQKIKSGKTKTVAAGAAPRPKGEGKVIDIMHLLRQSVRQANAKESPARTRKAG